MIVPSAALAQYGPFSLAEDEVVADQVGEHPRQRHHEQIMDDDGQTTIKDTHGFDEAFPRTESLYLFCTAFHNIHAASTTSPTSHGWLIG